MAVKQLAISFGIGATIAGGFYKAFSKAGTAIEEINKKTNNLRKNQADLKKYEKLQLLRKDTRSEIIYSEKELKKLKKQMELTAKETGENSKESVALSKQYLALQNKIISLRNAQKNNIAKIRETSKSLKEQNISVRDIEKSYTELEKKVERYNRALQKYQIAERKSNTGASLSKAGTPILKTAGIATGVGLGALHGAISAESAFADVKKQFDFVTKEIEEKFKTDLQKIVTEKKIAISLEDLYGMAANAGQSGLSQEEALSYIEAASKMAVAFGMNRDEASKYMFTWKNAFGMDLTQLKELTDQINILGNNTGATEGQISEFVTRLGNIPKLAGMAENQTAALGASLIEMGMAPEVAATGAKKLLNVLSKGMAADKSEREALDILGLDPEYLAITAKKDSEKAMDIVFSALSKAKEDQQSAIMTMLFGEEGKVAGANILSSYEKYLKNLALVKNKNQYQGATEKEYSNRENTTENRLQVLKTQFDILKADFGTELLPFLEEGMKHVSSILGNITTFMKENPDGFKRLIKTLVYGTGVLYGLGGGLKFIGFTFKVYSGYSKLAGMIIEKEFIGRSIKSLKNFRSIVGNTAKGTVSAGRTIVKGIGSIASKGFALMTNPVGLAIMGITALVAAGYLLYKNWDTAKQKAGELKNKVGELIDKYWYFLGPIGYLIKAGKSIYENWDTIKLKASELKEKLVDMVMNGIENFNEFKDKVVAVLGIPFDYMKEKVENLKNAGKELKDYFLGIFEEIKNFSLKETIKSGASYLWERGKEFIPGFATGGIVNSPTLAMIGEGVYSEAVIPLNNDSNSLNLWEKTGRLIGAYENAGSQSSYNNEFKFTYAPVVTASNAAGVKDVLENDARMKYEEFKAYFDRYEREMFRRGRNGR